MRTYLLAGAGLLGRALLSHHADAQAKAEPGKAE